MKSLPLVLVVTLIFSITPLSARLGDSASSLDRRMTADRLAIEVRGALVDTILSRGHLSPPQRRNDPLRRISIEFRDVEEGLEHKVYFKSANGDRFTSTDTKEVSFSNGWIYTAIFLRGVVVAEMYERRNIGGDSSINTHERNGLLVLNQGGSSWLNLEDMVLPDGTEVSGIMDYQYMRGDEKAFARFERNSAVFIRKELDEKLREQRSGRNEERDAENRESVRASLSGF